MCVFVCAPRRKIKSLSTVIKDIMAPGDTVRSLFALFFANSASPEQCTVSVNDEDDLRVCVYVRA